MLCVDNKRYFNIQRNPSAILKDSNYSKFERLQKQYKNDKIQRLQKQ